MKKFKAVIFDMDGVLVDTENYYSKRRTQFFDQINVSIAHLKPSDFIGGNMKDLWPRILQDQYEPTRAQSYIKQYNDFKAKTPLPYEKLLFEDAHFILEFLKKQQVKLALASSSNRADIERCLSVNHLAPYFDAVLSGADFKKSKPDPAIYEAAMATLGVLPHETLVIEDSENGIISAKAAGATVFAISDARFGMNQSKADYRFTSLREIVQILKHPKN